jgi:hypothetical protein
MDQTPKRGRNETDDGIVKTTAGVVRFTDLGPRWSKMELERMARIAAQQGACAGDNGIYTA